MWPDRIRWLILVGFLGVVDWCACRICWERASTPRFDPGGSSGGISWYFRGFADGRREQVVTNLATGAVRIIPVIPATPMGLIMVWWWPVAGLAATGLMARFARTDRGRRFLGATLPPRLSIRGWSIAIALIGLEFGLVAAMRKDRAVDPNWTLDPPAFVVLHVVILYVLGLILLVRLRIGKEEEGERKKSK